jgi:hypothetical protein
MLAHARASSAQKLFKSSPNDACLRIADVNSAHLSHSHYLSVELGAQNTPNQPVDAIENAYVDQRIRRKRRRLSSNDSIETAPVERTRLNPASSAGAVPIET